MKLAQKIFFLFLFSTHAQAISNDEAVNFINGLLEKKGVKGCKKVVGDMLRKTSPESIRGNVRVLPGEKDAISLTVTYGRKGDTVMIDSFVRKINGKCFATMSANLAFSGSCLSLMNKNKDWKYIDETGDFIWLQSKTGTVILAKPIGNSCYVSMLTDFGEN